MAHKIKLTFTVVLMFLFFGLMGCNSDYSGSYNSSSSYQKTKMTLEEKEKQNPTSFLATKGTYWKNLIGEWVIKGTISNSATIATYKDVVLRIYFYSKTGTLLGTEKKIIYEYFPARQTKKFKIKTYGYQGTKKIDWEIIRASSAN